VGDENGFYGRVGNAANAGDRLPNQLAFGFELEFVSDMLPLTAPAFIRDDTTGTGTAIGGFDEAVKLTSGKIGLDVDETDFGAIARHRIGNEDDPRSPTPYPFRGVAEIDNFDLD
jgi:hypothetical protein